MILSMMSKLYPFPRGWGRLQSILAPMLPEYSVESTPQGKMIIHSRSIIDWAAVPGLFETNVIQNFIELTKDNFEADYFMDIGANIGLYSLSFAKEFSHLQVKAFEPQPKIYSQLNMNFSLNDYFPRCRAFNYGISEEESILEMSVPKNSNANNAGMGRIGGFADKTLNIETFNIETKKLDSFFDLKDKNIAIKIDVEGHEESALKGMKDLVKNNNVLMQIEIFPENLSEVMELLNSMGLNEIMNSKIDKNYYVKNF